MRYIDLVTARLYYKKMYSFGSDEMRERCVFLENLQEEFVGTLRTQPVVERLGESTVAELLQIAEGLYVPNISSSDRLVRIPREYRDTDHIPMIAFRKGEQFALGNQFAYMNPAQKTHLSAQLEDLGWGAYASQLPGMAARSILEAAEHRAIETRLWSGGGFCDARGAKIVKKPERDQDTHDQKTWIFLARPIIGLCLDEYEDEEKRLFHPLPILAHEVTHAGQVIKKPMRSGNEHPRITANEEFAAYQNGARYGTALYFSDDERYRGDVRLLGNVWVEYLRQQHEEQGAILN